MYKPLQSNKRRPTGANFTSSGATKGKNLRDMSQVLDPSQAVNLENVWIEGEGRTPKREGYDTVYTHGSSVSGIDAMATYTNDDLLVAYDTTLAIVDTTAWTAVEIKTDFSAEITTIKKYGDYAFVGNGEDKIYRVSKTLAYDGQTVNFAVGETVTGGTSGATAIILEDADAGATGTLTLGSIVGVFEDNESLTSPGGGDGNVNGVVTAAVEEIADAPRASVIEVIGPRLFAGGIKGEEDKVIYSEVDDGSNPPFDGWTQGTTSLSAGALDSRGMGAVTGIQSFDQLVVVFSERGRYAFNIGVFDSAGTISKKDDILWEERGLGGSGASKITEYGLFYTDAKNVRVLEQIGTSDIKYSSRELKISSALSDRYMEKFNFDEAKIIEDSKRELVYILCKKSSAFNNWFLVWHPKTSAFSEFSALNLQDIVEIDGVMHAGLSNETKIVELFNGQSSDDGRPIYTEIIQEVTGKGPYSYSDTERIYIEGWLHPESSTSICFDKWSYTNAYTENVKCITWTPDLLINTANAGIGGAIGAPIGGGGVEGDDYVVDYPGLVSNFAGRRLVIRRYKKLRIKITTNHIYPSVFSWYTILSKEVGNIRKANLTL